jgi:Domain of unknown function (DUF5615)
VSVPLYMDHHVPRAITLGLRERDVEVLTAFEDGTAEIEDEQVLQRANVLGRCLFTQDDDFLAIAHRWLHEGREFAGLIYSAQLSITIGQAVRDLELIAKVLTPNDLRNRIEYLPLR